MAGGRHRWHHLRRARDLSQRAGVRPAPLWAG
jgi:hypothetical protein